MRALASDFMVKHTKTSQERGADKKDWGEWQPTLQTGENPDDPLFEGKLIFCTVDQLLASFLGIPYGISRRLDNLNTGALVGSYLIFDEFHLYPQQEMMLTVIAMLKMLKGISRFTLMSATFSPLLLKKLAELLEAVAIYDEPSTPLSAGRFSDIAALQSRERRFYAMEGALTAQAVLAKPAPRRICICNTVDRAQKLYQDLQARKPEGVELILLHSRFYREHRRILEDKVLGGFSLSQAEYEATTGNKALILVATQVIEVGLDLTCDVMFSECAPASSLIQRAGRCARKAGEIGEVYIFEPWATDRKTGEYTVNYAPYIDEGQLDVCQKTWEALQSSQFHGQVMDFMREQQWVEFAHTAADEQLIQKIELALPARIEEISQSMASHNGNTNQLIRKNTQARVFIHPDPKQDETLQQKPWQRESFGLSHGQLADLFEQSQEVGIEAPFYMAAGQAQPEESEEEQRYPSLVYKWDYLRTAKDVYGQWVFVLHPEILTYTPDLGLQLAAGPLVAETSPLAKTRAYSGYQLHAERYHEHICALYKAYHLPSGTSGQGAHRALKAEVLYPLRKLCEALGEDWQLAESYLLLTLALHDVGKLNQAWQAWAKAWQAEIQQVDHDFHLDGVPLEDPSPLAHTRFYRDDSRHKALKKAFKHPPRGTHAVESAAAIEGLIRDLTTQFSPTYKREWTSVILASIMHHHSPSAKEGGAFKAVPGAPEAVAQALKDCGFESEAETWAQQIRYQFPRTPDMATYIDMISASRDHWLWPLMYFLFVRILRLADQRSTSYWQTYKRDYYQETQ
jgi:CRISPR-associated endonuclease/helicase Cas3